MGESLREIESVRGKGRRDKRGKTERKRKITNLDEGRVREGKREKEGWKEGEKERRRSSEI